MKTLLVYYSFTGNTKIIADKIKERIHCDVLELKPKIPFLIDDYQKIVDEWQSNESTKKEVPIEDINIDLTDYDKVIIGTPVWWYTITPVMRSFLNKYDLSNKKVYAFACNAGWLGKTFQEIEKYCKLQSKLNVTFTEDYTEHKYLINEEEIEKWIGEMK